MRYHSAMKSLANRNFVTIVLVILLIIGILSSDFSQKTELNTRLPLNAKRYLFHILGTSEDSVDGACTPLLQNIRNMTVTDNLFRILLKTCTEHINDGWLNSTFLNQTFHDFEETCPKRQKFLTNPRPLVALASYPGSGNTWNRELIETTTGIQTGSIYQDWNFEGSQKCPSRGKIFIVKTHLTNQKTHHGDCGKLHTTTLNYTKDTPILRNPYDAILAEFNRQTSAKRKFPGNGGVGLAQNDDFKTKGWDKFVTSNVAQWMNMAQYWLTVFPNPVHVLVYERVRNNTMEEMYRLANFLEMKISFNNLYCLSSGSVGNYHRQKPKWMTPKNLYNNEQRKLVNSKIAQLEELLQHRHNLSNILMQYLLPLQ